MKKLEIYQNQKSCYIADSVGILGTEAGLEVNLHNEGNKYPSIAKKKVEEET